ncbi:MAG TPA: DEAD/DEAH box helicase [Phycisphaerales bacterium]|nr:DEAD/DEAH box helicase [Phycisphaerales bacterium]HIO20504.1 DEAD/DEAH box helicase [Phycisphaerales bacterium]HIO52714.1 DEAD/DEAH box helicase [Phycisphaerales bacterium]
MTTDIPQLLTFDSFGLDSAILDSVNKLGYESPTPIQAESIPPLLEGRDILGQAQTGSGKTAAFALPLLSNLNLKKRSPQILVLTPTRELAIQVSEAFQKYAGKLKGFHVVPIYGGQDYRVQFRALDRGVHVVVGTPGRVMDHMRKGSMNLDNLQCLVLDEADEMLRMGFIDDVEWVLEQIPTEHQTALFSATMPKQIAKIAKKYLNDPALIQINDKSATVDTVRQRYWMVSGMHKLDALTRILEVEDTDGILVFARTKIMTTQLSDKLEARGFAAKALNGDMPQNQRELTVNKLKSGKLDILIATDVAARGLDVPRISHVINYDVPHDTETYVHRIGRTARAGREGDAILFISPREKRMLHSIEKATRQKIERMDLPSHSMVNEVRVERFKQRITDTLAVGNEKSFFAQIVESYSIEHDVPPVEIAVALASMAQGDSPLLLDKEATPRFDREDRGDHSNRRERRDRGDRSDRGDRGDRRERRDRKDRTKKSDPVTQGMERFHISVGKAHGVKPASIVGAISSVAGLSDKEIGRIELHDRFSFVELPFGMPKEVFNDLKHTKVAGEKLAISIVKDSSSKPKSSKKKQKGKGGKKK